MMTPVKMRFAMGRPKIVQATEFVNKYIIDDTIKLLEFNYINGLTELSVKDYIGVATDGKYGSGFFFIDEEHWQIYNDWTVVTIYSNQTLGEI